MQELRAAVIEKPSSIMSEYRLTSFMSVFQMDIVTGV